MEAKLLFLGDSILKGAVYDQSKGRYFLLKDSAASLVARAKGLQEQNLSRFGATVEQGLQRLEKDPSVLEDCRQVILDFGGNDSDFCWEKIARDPSSRQDCRVPLERFYSLYSQLLRLLRQQGKIPVVLNLPPVDHRRYFAWISRGLNGQNILSWLGGSSEFIYRWHEQFSLAVHQIARQAQVPLIDVRSAFLVCRDYSGLLCADGIHPNAQGHALLAKTILESGVPEQVPAMA